MSNYRFYIRAAAGFNNTTGETATYVQSGLVWTTAITGAVGRWSPAKLGRDNVCSLVRVNLEGTVLGSDTVRIYSSNNQIRREVPASLDSSGWLFLTPQDELAIACAGGVQAGILVMDLTPEQVVAWIMAEAAGVVPDLPLPQLDIDVTATQAIPAYNGPLIVHVDAAADADLTLPALADTTAGKAKITVIRTGGAGQPRIIPEDAGDEVNGRTGVVANQYYLRSIGDGVTYNRVGAGWAMSFGDQAQTTYTSASNPIGIPAVRSGTLYVIDTAATLDNQADLPPTGNCTQGSRIAVLNTDTQRHLVKPQVGDSLNDTVNGTQYVGPKQVALFELDGTNWIGYGGGNQGLNLSSAGAINLTALQVSGNITTLNTTGAASQDVNLPPVADVAPGSIVVVYNSSGNTHDINPNGTDLINNANATVNVATTKRIIIVAINAAVGWATILGA